MNTFNIIRHYNSPNKGEYRGIIVHRQEKLWVPDYGFVTCAPYDDHFIFEVPKHLIDSTYRCTCGAPAVIVGFGAYAQDASPSKTSGYMLLCMLHSQYGHHATGGDRWI